MNEASHQPPSDDARLQDLLDGRLEDAQAAALRSRIEREPVLCEAWEELRAVQALVRGHGPRGADLDPPADFGAQVRARIAQEASAAVPAASSRRRPGRMLRLLTVAYAAAALLVVGFGLRIVLQSEDASAPATQTTAAGAAAREEPSADEDALLRADTKAGLDEVARMRPDAPVAERAERVADGLGEPGAGAKRGGRLPAGDGRFGSPGGTLPPGLRAPRDAVPVERKSPAPQPSAAPRVDAPAASLDDPLAARPGEVVYVLQADSEGSARQALQALLVGAMLREERDQDEERGDAFDKRPPLDFFEVDAQEAARLAARFERARAPAGLGGGAPSGTAPGPKAPPADPAAPADRAGVVLLDVIARELPPASAAWLQRQSRAGTWAADRYRPQAAEKPSAPAPAEPAPTSPDSPAAPPPAPVVPTTPAAPAAPAAPPSVPGGPKVARAARPESETVAKSGRRGRGDPGRTADGAEAEPQGAPARRVRILLLVRRP